MHCVASSTSLSKETPETDTRNSGREEEEGHTSRGALRWKVDKSCVANVVMCNETPHLVSRFSLTRGGGKRV